MVGAGFEPAKAEPPDLQSGPFGHSGIPPSFLLNRPHGPQKVAKYTLRPDLYAHMHDQLAEGLEPTTAGLQNRSSAN